MTAVALDFCAEELELRGGREVGRCTIIEKTVKELIKEVWQSSCNWLWWFLEKERICFRKDDLSVLESGECQSLIQVRKRNWIHLLEQFASHAGTSIFTVCLAGASIFKSLPSVWQQLERDFHCRLGRGKGSLLFWNTSSWRNPLRLITETLGYQHHGGKDELSDFL